jgi:hypothetical protein
MGIVVDLLEDAVVISDEDCVAIVKRLQKVKGHASHVIKLEPRSRDKRVYRDELFTPVSSSYDVLSCIARDSLASRG